jgi:hypothetical protein
MATSTSAQIVRGAIDNNGAERCYFQNEKCESRDFGTIGERGSSNPNDEYGGRSMAEFAEVTVFYSIYNMVWKL